MGGTEHAHTVRVRIGGRVQGVGFRFWTEREAARRGVRGWVRNLPDGTVEAVFSGEAAAVAGMVEACRQGPSAAEVDTLAAEDAEDPAPGADGFRILRG